MFFSCLNHKFPIVSQLQEETSPIQHQMTMPKVPPPEELKNTTEILTSLANDEKHDQENRKWWSFRFVFPFITLYIFYFITSNHIYYGLITAKKKRNIFWDKSALFYIIMYFFSDDKDPKAKRVRFVKAFFRLDNVPSTIEMRPVNADEYVNLKPSEPKLAMWVKTQQPIG